MLRTTVILSGLIAFAGGCAITTPMKSRDELISQVTALEIAFAKTMADRDHGAFMRFVAEDAVFLN